jgi:cellulose synthase/poly-beta-1,6-N-acetylglucosamine synthase-like glycosyltransferase
MLVEGSLIYDSRDAIARYGVDNDYDYVLYADSDMMFGADDLKKLVAHDVGICSGLYVTRRGENTNVCYSKIITRRRFPFRSPRLIVDTQTSGYAPAAAVGFGFCLIKCSVLKSMFKRYKSLFEPFKGVGEDIAFCIRAKRCGYQVFVDRNVKLGHIGEKIYE